MNDTGFFDADGMWVSENPVGFKNWLSKHSNKRAVLKLKKWYKQRTRKQNAYMHWMFTDIGNQLGYEMEDVKGWYKIHFRFPSTSESNTVELEEFLDKVRRHCLEFHGYYVRLPNEVICE